MFTNKLYFGDNAFVTKGTCPTALSVTGTDECQTTECRLNFDQVQVTCQCCLGIYRPYLVSLVQPYIIHHQKYSPDTDKMLLFLLFKKYCTLGDSL